MATLLGPAPCRQCRALVVWGAHPNRIAWRDFAGFNRFDRVPIAGAWHVCPPVLNLERRLATYVGPRRQFVDQAHPVTAFGRSLVDELELRALWGDR